MSTREINAAIADAFERLAWTDKPEERIGIALLRVAAELRATEPAMWKCPSCEFSCSNQNHAHMDCLGRFPHTHEHQTCVQPEPAPPPSLVERLRAEAANAALEIGEAWNMMDEAADSLEAAQADSRRIDALERWARRVHGGWPIRLDIGWTENESLRILADAIAAEMERKP